MQWPDDSSKEIPIRDSNSRQRKAASSQTKKKGRKNKSDIVDLRIPNESTDAVQESISGSDHVSDLESGAVDAYGHSVHHVGPRGETREVWGRKEKKGLAVLEELFSESVSPKTLVSVSVFIR